MSKISKSNIKLFFNKVVFLLSNRFILFFILLLIFFCSYYLYSGSFFPSTDTRDLWFYSGLFMVVFSIFFIEPYYTSPKNVITNVIPLLLVFLSIKSSFPNDIFWWFSLASIILLLFASVLAMALEDKSKSPAHLRNKFSDWLKKIVVILGRGKVLYSCVFVYFLLTYFSVQNFYTLTLFIFWFLIVLVDPKFIHNEFMPKKHDDSFDQVGEIFGVQSKKMFLAKIFGDKTSLAKFDIVKFRYSMQDNSDNVIIGIVFDTYLLNQEKWAKILELKNINSKTENLEKNTVYKISDKTKIKVLSKDIKIKKFVGVIIEGSTIGKIKFEYSKKKDDLQEGDLLELNIADKRLFYQVIAGTTETEKLEARNETGYIIGEAIQLGGWQSDKLSFQKFGWVPPINTPIFEADTSNIDVDTYEYPLFKLGNIPGTLLPSIINLHDAVSHHLALMGITGSGKTFLSIKIIEALLTDTKVICIDFTGEWKKKIDPSIVQITNRNDVVSYLSNSDQKIGLFELPALSNTTDVLKETQSFLEIIFNYAKAKYDENSPVKIALVLEEAHTITPETGFLGDLGDYGSNKALVNKMTQVALQGRKYGIGLIVIAQRTANVSKTILTQCNTVICFQAFDETGFTFLGNYVGKNMVEALPNLKQFHAIVAGKAIKSNMPMIVDLKI